MTGHSDHAFLDLVSQALSEPLPGPAAHRPVTPELAYGRHRGPARKSNHLSAVLVGLVEREGNWHVPLTVRAIHLPFHAGQVSLPGGKLEDDETPWFAAKREFTEELGVQTDGFVQLGQLTPLHVFASRHWVVPIVAASREPLLYSPNPDEVDSVFEVPIQHLLSASFTESKIQQRGLLSFDTFGFCYQSHFIWGATAMILHELRLVMHKVLGKIG
jgi:8-oxo-dGTP pyrophosphatase MutT (NUDIX family)